MNTTLSIKTKIEQIILIIDKAHQLERDSYKMLITDTSVKYTVIARNPFLLKTRISLWELSVIELHKLFGSSKNDHFKIETFIEQMIKNHSSAEWSNQIKIDELKKLKEEFDNLENQTSIKKLQEIRGKFYAHTDENPLKNIYDVRFHHSDHLLLTQLAKIIICKIINSIYDEKFIFETYDGEDLDTFMDNYIQYIESTAKLRLIES
jgi:hypothetical protein